MHGVQRPVSLEYQIYPPSSPTLYDTLVTGMGGGGGGGEGQKLVQRAPTSLCQLHLNTSNCSTLYNAHYAS